MDKKAIVVLILITNLFINCGITHFVSLKNTPFLPDKTSEKSNNKICFSELIDNRKDSIIGNVKNGYGMIISKAIAKNNVAKWVNDEINIRLKNEGYEVISDCLDTNCGIKIKGNIDKVTSTLYNSYIGEVNINLQVEYNKDKLFKKQYVGFENKYMYMGAASDTAFSIILESSLHSAINQMMKDLDSLNNIKNTQNNNFVKSNINIKNVDSVKVIHSENNNCSNCPKTSGKIKVLNGGRFAIDIENNLFNVINNASSFYEKRFEVDSSLSGYLCILISISDNGNVEKAIICDNTINDIPLKENIIKSINNTKFNKISKQDKNTEVLLRLNFIKESVKSSRSSKAFAYALLFLIPVITVICIFALRNPNH